MRTGTPVAKPYVEKSYTYRFTGDDFAHPLRAMAQWVHRHPEARVVSVDLVEKGKFHLGLGYVLVLLTVTFPDA